MITTFVMPIIVRRPISVSSKAYLNKPTTTEEFKNNIREKIAAIPAKMSVKTMENAEKLAQYAVNSQGGYLRDILFKK